MYVTKPSGCLARHHSLSLQCSGRWVGPCSQGSYIHGPRTFGRTQSLVPRVRQEVLSSTSQEGEGPRDHSRPIKPRSRCRRDSNSHRRSRASTSRTNWLPGRVCSAHSCISRTAAHEPTDTWLGLLVQSLFLLLNPTMTRGTPGLSPRHPRSPSLRPASLPCPDILRSKPQQRN